ncbi:ROK family transcriptional regulator [Arthrobacter sp. SLBN-112]|uniref:ROK family transcriptional regulator n=1 Tax=Arthrobacter sp. SLBN-112 TaxID=2768452 RepID=UPI0027AF4A40|nr:ROK family transcriptional regulator [Arthrobacter sp. SLBN-112]MDQ0799370.1 putative NBD/HSP70 family sugar kinase [Arthrobacter sp. SLBN-112]
MPRGSNLERVSAFNQAVVLDLVRRSESGMSRVELIGATGLSTQTVSNIARRLLDLGLILESGKVHVPQGKPRTTLTIDPKSKYAVGAHLDPSMLTFVLLDLAGTVVHRKHLPVVAVAGPEETVARIAAAIEDLISETDIPRTRVLGVGIAAPGPIEFDQGAVVGPPMLTGWERVELRESLGKATGFPVFLDKDSAAAAHAELWVRDKRSDQNFAFVYLGSGVGAAVVMNGEVVRGSSNNVGEIGHFSTGEGGRLCGCGRKGCLGISIMPVELVNDAVVKGILSGPVDDSDLRQITDHFHKLAALADAGDQSASSIFQEAADRLARAVEDIANLLDVDGIVFGGPSWPPVGTRYLEVLHAALANRLAMGMIHEVELVGSVLGEDITAVGAACIVLDHVLAPRSGGLLLE